MTQLPGNVLASDKYELKTERGDGTMNESVKLVHADHTGMEKTRWDQTFSREEAEKVRAFHRSFPD